MRWIKTGKIHSACMVSGEYLREISASLRPRMHQATVRSRKKTMLLHGQGIHTWLGNEDDGCTRISGLFVKF